MIYSFNEELKKLGCIGCEEVFNTVDLLLLFNSFINEQLKKAGS